MPEWTLHQCTTAIVAIVAAMVGLLAWLRPRHPRSDTVPEIARFEAYQGGEYPAIHATNGVPTLQQLTKGMELDARKIGFARLLYESGLQQFNQYINNRDGMIEESRTRMASLADGLSQTEIRLATSVGVSLAANRDSEHREAVQTQYRDLSPQAQVYAQQKRHETDAIRRIARDLEVNVPRTDYTSVKALISSGNVKLDSIVSELPVPWQDITTLNQKARRPRIAGKPPKREFVHVIFMMGHRGLLEDKQAERDGDWIISDKHEMIAPYQKPVPIYLQLEGDGLPVRKGEALIITGDAGTEWQTEFWKMGGRLDQVYLRIKNGLSPEQLRRGYRRRLINRTAWTAIGVLLIADVILLAMRYPDGP